MSTSKYFDRICVIVFLAALVITVLFMNGESLGITVVRDADQERYEEGQYFTENDLNGSWDPEGAEEILLQDTSVNMSGNGAYMRDGDLVITASGRYVIRGSLSNGSIRIDASRNSKIWLLLDGVSLFRQDDACIRIDEADKVFLTLAPGSQNTVESGSVYGEEALSDGTDGVIFARDDLTINGSGALTVRGGCKHGISANDDLVITGGYIDVTSPEDGIRANDRLNLCSADITVHAGDDAIVLNHDTGTLCIASGTLTLYAKDDGIHSASDILLNDGSLQITCADDAFHTDAGFSMTGGDIHILDSHEGIEAHDIRISGGTLEILCRDDGMNANSGLNSQDLVIGPDGVQTETARSAPSSLPAVTISGGSIRIYNPWGMNADGIDSNGDITINGGSVFISLLGTGENCPLDCGLENGGTLLLNGGIIIACGGTAAEAVSEASTQCALLYLPESYTSSDMDLVLMEENGETLLSEKIPLSFSSAILSCPGLKKGQAYQLGLGEEVISLILNEAFTTIRE